MGDESFLQTLNNWFYSGFLNELGKKKVEVATLNFSYKSLRITHKQTSECGETSFFIGGKKVFSLNWQECSQSGTFYNKEKAMSNPDFVELMNDYIEWCPFDLTYDDFEEE